MRIHPVSLSILTAALLCGAVASGQAISPNQGGYDGVSGWYWPGTVHVNVLAFPDGSSMATVPSATSSCVIAGVLVLAPGCYSGDMGAQINTALASSACASGCTIDATPLTGAQSSAANISISHANTSLRLGNVTLSMGANQLLVSAGANRVSITGVAPWGGQYMATGTGGSVIKYTGTTSPLVVGDSSAATNFFVLKDVAFDISTAGTAAIGLTTNRLITGSIIRPNVMGSNISNGTQEGIQINSTGAGWSGIISLDQPIVHGVHRAIDLNGVNPTTFGVTTVTVNGGVTICATSDTTSEGWYAQQGDTNVSNGFDAESCAIGFHFGPAETRFKGSLARTEGDTTDFQFETSAAYNSVNNNNLSPVIVNNSGNTSNAVVLNSIQAQASATTHQWVQYIDATGVQHLSQPAASDISGLGGGSPTTICNQTSWITNTGSTTGNIIGSCDIPKGTMGATSRLFVKLWGAACKSAGVPFAGCAGINTGTCGAKVAWNTAAANSGTSMLNQAIVAASHWESFLNVANTATNAQQLDWVAFSSGVTQDTPTTAALDTSGGSGTDTFVVFVMTNSVSGDVCGEHWTVELWP